MVQTLTTSGSTFQIKSFKLIVLNALRDINSFMIKSTPAALLTLRTEGFQSSYLVYEGG